MSKSKKELQELQENELVSWADKNLAEILPYWPQIALAVAAGFLAFVGFMYYSNNTANLEAAKWQDLSTAIYNSQATGDVSSLTFLADEYPKHPAGMWALQLAGDSEMRSGVREFPIDRKSGLDKVKKAQELFERIVDSNVKKTPMLQRRSIFGLAYAAETAGDFETAKANYQKVIDEGEKSPFYEAAVRGLNRSGNVDFVAFFDKFRDYEEATESDAPGQILPDRPDIDFPDLGAMNPDSGGEFGDEKEATPESAGTEEPNETADNKDAGDDGSKNDETTEPDQPNESGGDSSETPDEVSDESSDDSGEENSNDG